MIRRISHVGIVVENLDESLRMYEKLFGLRPRAIVDALGGKVKAAFVPIGEGEIELLQPIDLSTMLMEFLRKQGSGIHHISLATDNIEHEVDRMRKHGVVFDRERPTVGAHGMRIIFTSAQSTGGIPIELIEEPKNNRKDSHT